MVRTRVFHAFASAFKEQQFEELKRQLIGREWDCLLLGNYKVCHIDYDAIIVTSRDIYIVEFKESHPGVITINDTGWVYATDGTAVWSGCHANTPFEQMRLKRNCLYGRLRMIKNRPLFIKTLVIFSEPFRLEKGKTVLRNVQEGTHSWFLIGTPKNMADTLWNHASSSEEEDKKWFNRLTSYFGLKDCTRTQRWQRILAMLSRPTKIYKFFWGEKYFPCLDRKPLLCIR